MITHTWKITGSVIHIKVVNGGANTDNLINIGNILDDNISLEKINELTSKWCQTKQFSSIPNKHWYN